MMIVARCGIALSQESEKPKTNATDIAKPPTVRVAKPLKEFTNSIGMKFKLIPAGEFRMGSPPSDGDAWAEEKPCHIVRITQPFFIGVTEVTQGQYEQVTGRNPSAFSAAGRFGDRVEEMDTSSFPVERVRWDDAVEFCKKLSTMDDRKYRLPTEAEWEYACRAGATTKWCFGDDGVSLKDYAWYDDNADDRPHPVGQRKPNRWGLFDMHGNVWEWCSDWHTRGGYSKLPEEDPTGAVTGSSRVIRGGSWYAAATICRSAYRDWYHPTYRHHDRGFRVVAVPSGQ
jgi:formylglycine-generating enzyme required for sulfatase activity